MTMFLYHHTRSLQRKIIGTLILLLIALGFSLYFVYTAKKIDYSLYFYAGSLPLFWLSLGTAVLLSAILVAMGIYLAARRPLAQIDSAGIKLSGYFIKWSEIEALTLYSIERQQFIGIVLADPIVTLAPYPWWKRLACEIGFYFSKAHFSLTDLDRPLEEVYEILRAYIEKSEDK
jgi:hypothetical protein